MKINYNPAMYPNCVFLGGTCAGSTWRDELTDMLDDSVLFFDPVVDVWTDEDAAREDACKKQARLNVFVLTNDSLSAYSGFEVSEESHRAPERLVFAAIGEFPENQRKGITKIGRELSRRGCHVFSSLAEIAAFLNTVYAG